MSEQESNYNIRYAVRVFAFKDNKVACIKYKNINKDYFDIPGGKIEDGETEVQTCIREFKEETGMDIDNLKCIGNIEILMTTIPTGYQLSN